MKVAKVNHVRTAVMEQNGTSQPGGILYKYPEKEEDVKEEINSHVESRCEAVRRLYRVFSQPKENDKKIKQIVSWFNAAVKDTKLLEKPEKLKNNSVSDDQILEKLKNEIEAKKPENVNITEEDIDKTIETCLRRSLYLMEVKGKNEKKPKEGTAEKYSCKDAVKKLLKAALMPEQKWDDSVKHEIKKGFLEGLKRDIERIESKMKENLIKAVRHQNMVVQPSDDSVIRISQRAANKDLEEKKESYDHKEKQAFETFISAYATLDEKKREEMLLRLRRILVLYFYGEEETEHVKNVWQDHECRKKEEKSVAELVKEEDGSWNLKETRAVIRKWNIERYRDSIEETKENETCFYFEEQTLNQFWIHRIENEVEKIYKKRIGAHKLKIGYLSEKVWKNLLNLISVKYVAFGKAVYQFVLGEKLADSGRKTITSFDYELIKAEERFQRETAVYIAFAANHLAGTVIDRNKAERKQEDIFLLKEKTDFNKLKQNNTLKNILQFFGGESQWKKTIFQKYEGVDKEFSLFETFQNPLYALRNKSFHFHTENEGKKWDDTLIGSMFEEECKRCVSLQRDKFYSNNLPMFYNDSDLKNILHELYNQQRTRAAQVPAFNKVFVRKDFSDFLKKEFKISTDFRGDGKETADSLEDKWESALYYLLKEIYYNLFLPSESYEDFDKAAEELKADAENAKAFDNFKTRIEELKGFSLSEICQTIMTERNLYNDKNRKVKPGQIREDQKDHYAHYEILLHKTLRIAFRTYLEDEKFAFIKGSESNGGRKVHKKDMPEADKFLTSYGNNLGQYQELVTKVKEHPAYQSWYLLGRFLTPKQVNMLVGAVRSHVQYVSDVKRRAEKCGVLPSKKAAESAGFFETVDNILDVCTHLSGMTSNHQEDYFDNAEDYANHVAQYLEIEESGGTMADRLKEFCGEFQETIQEDEQFQSAGLFYDEKNPIMNRNVIAAKLYGTETVVAAAVQKVNKDDIRNYFEYKEKIKSYRSTGKCKTKEELENLKKFQETKNKVELTNIAEYSEILDELQGQLVNWCYLRERDLMYYQLGFHYVCLHNESEKPEGYRTLTCGNTTVEEMILHQIAAIYINGLSVFRYDEKKHRWEKGDKSASVGGKIGHFMSYTKATIERENVTGEEYYNAGLEIFEKISMHDSMTDLRNYIVHFHYFVKQDCSMLDLYSEMFETFFSYDRKYGKNVGNQLYNILLRHFVKLQIQFGEKEAGGKAGNPSGKKRAAIMLKKGCGLEADVFTYKIEQKKIMIPARGKDFLENIARILYHRLPKDEAFQASDFVKPEQESEKSSEQEGKRNHTRKQKEEEKRRVEKESLTYTMGELMKGFKI